MHEKQAQIVSITSQGQLTVPKSIRRAFGIKSAVKAVIRKAGDKIIVEPKENFWQLSGSLSGKIKLSDRALAKARAEFAKKWPRHA